MKREDPPGQLQTPPPDLGDPVDVGWGPEEALQGLERGSPTHLSRKWCVCMAKTFPSTAFGGRKWEPG